MKTDIDFLKSLTLVFCASVLSSGYVIHKEVTTVMLVIFAVSFLGAAVTMVWLIKLLLDLDRKDWITITTSDKNYLKKGDTIMWSSGTGNSEGRVMRVENNVIHIKPKKL